MQVNISNNQPNASGLAEASAALNLESLKPELFQEVLTHLDASAALTLKPLSRAMRSAVNNTYDPIIASINQQSGAVRLKRGGPNTILPKLLTREERLTQIQGPGITTAALIAFAFDNIEDVRQAALNRLSLIKPPTEDIIQCFIKICNASDDSFNNSPETIEIALKGLTEIARPSETVINAIAAVAEHEENEESDLLRLNAITKLTSLAPTSKRAIQALLIVISKDPSQINSIDAHNCLQGHLDNLQKIEGTHLIVSTIVQSLSCHNQNKVTHTPLTNEIFEDDPLMDGALKVLGAMDNTLPPPTIPALTQLALEHSDKETRISALHILSKIIQNDEIAQDTFALVLARDTDWQVKEVALDILREATNLPEKLVQSMTRTAHEDAQDIARALAISTIAPLADTHPQVFQTINTRALKDKSSFVRETALNALSEMTTQKDTLIQTLKKVNTSEAELHLRGIAVRKLEALGVANQSANKVSHQEYAAD